MTPLLPHHKQLLPSPVFFNHASENPNSAFIFPVPQYAHCQPDKLRGDFKLVATTGSAGEGDRCVARGAGVGVDADGGNCRRGFVGGHGERRSRSLGMGWSCLSHHGILPILIQRRTNSLPKILSRPLLRNEVPELRLSGKKCSRERYMSQILVITLRVKNEHKKHAKGNEFTGNNATHVNFLRGAPVVHDRPNPSNQPRTP